MTAFGRTGHAAAVYIVLAGLQRGMPLIILPFISLVMSPAEFGAASMLTASSLLVVTIIAAPLEALVFRAAARGGEDAPALLRATGIYCYFLMPVIVGLSAGIIALLIPNMLGVGGRIWAIELLAVGFQPAMTYFALPIVQARQNLSKFASLASASIVVMATSKVVLLMVLDLGVVGWVLSDLFTAVLSAGLAIVLVRLPRTRVAARHIRSVFSFAVPLIPHRASFWAITSLSRPAMAMVSSLSQVGLLALGLNVASVANLFLAEVNRALLPRYSREKFPAPTRQTFSAVRIQVVLAVTVPAVVGAFLALAGQRIFAEDYWPSFKLTGVLLVGQAAYGIYLLPTNYLVQAAGRTKQIALASGGGAVVMMICLLALGRSYGAIGAAFATTGGFLIMAIIAVSLTRILKLEVAWRSWARCWQESALGLAALVGSVIALTYPVGSSAGRVFAAACLLLAAGALVLSIRRSPGVFPGDTSAGPEGPNPGAGL